MSFQLKLGTRGSPLALAQAHETRNRIVAAHGLAEEAIEIVVIRTTGDAIRDRPLAEAGGKGLFTRELDSALAEGAIDLAVHSAKDVPTLLEPSITIAGYLPREDVRDALITRGETALADLPPGAKLGSASLRRQAQLRRARPDFQVSLLRGNVETRLRKVADGEFDATLLALAGLKRLGLAERANALLPIDAFLPACGQGAIALSTRIHDDRTQSVLAPILDATTERALAAERAFLRALDGSCRTPIAGHARIDDGGRLIFRGEVLRPDGAEHAEAELHGSPAEAEKIGTDAALQCLARMPSSWKVG